MIQIPAQYRTVWYWFVGIIAAGSFVANALGLIPADAVENGVKVGMQILTVLTAVLALVNIKPDGDTEEFMAPYVEDAYKGE